MSELITFQELYQTRFNDRVTSSLAFSINESYRLLEEFVEKNPILQIKTARKAHGHLRNSIVEIILKREIINRKLPIHYKEEVISNNGYSYLLMEFQDIVMTVHKTRTGVSVPRPAKNRISRSYQNRQLSLFEEPPVIELKTLPYYVMLTHGGKELSKPDYIKIGAVNPGAKSWVDDPIDITNKMASISPLSKEEDDEIELDFNSAVKQMLNKGVLSNGGIK
ncbi:hypothetical protein [Shouchella miscanthi]|uniref:Uncharacterized protein n=1 Tax=Shouchella miscanthi TaxID=2598861 RepID=A0ABU6NK69_9BACI|nr:hypothetical protein [Shouchella miscanthi]